MNTEEIVFFFFFFFFVYEMFMHIQMQGYTNSEIH